MKNFIKNMINKDKTKQTIHLHIGTHKTGTTSLQKFLSTNVDLLKKSDILYPKAGWYHYSQHLLAFHLRKATPNDIESISDTVWDDLYDEIKKSKLNNIILSSEIFALFNKKQIETLKEKLLNYDVKIYLYLRRQDEFFESIYNQQAKEWRNSRKEPISHFMNQMIKLYPHFNYFILVGNWIRVFEKDNVFIRPYNKEISSDTITDFTNLLNIDRDKFKNIKNENKSVSSKALEMVRLSKFIENDIELRKKVFVLANEVFPSSKNNTNSLNTEQKVKITNKFKKSNENLIENYFDVGKKYLLSPPKETENNEILTKSDLLYVIISLMKKGN